MAHGRPDEQIQWHADVVLAYLDLLGRLYSFYVSASEPIRRRILEAFFSVLWVEDESHQVRAQGQVHEPIALIQEAAAEWAATHGKSASDIADALDSTPSNLYLKESCPSKRSLVGLVESYSTKSWDAGHLRSLARLTGSRSAEPARKLPKKAKRLDDAELSAFQARYREGATVEVLAREFGVHRTTVMAFTKRFNLHRPIRATSVSQIDQAAALYQGGESLAEVAKRYGVGVETMRTALLAVGQELRPRGRPRREAARA